MTKAKSKRSKSQSLEEKKEEARFKRIYALSQKAVCITTVNGERSPYLSSSWIPVSCEPPFEEYMARSMFYAIQSSDPFQKEWQMPTITQLLGKASYYPNYAEDYDVHWMFNDTQSRQGKGI